MDFPVYLRLGPLSIHPHLLFEALAYTIAFRLLLHQVRQDSIAPTQRSSVVVSGMVGALIGAQILVLLQHINDDTSADSQSLPAASRRFI